MKCFRVCVVHRKKPMVVTVMVKVVGGDIGGGGG